MRRRLLNLLTALSLLLSVATAALWLRSYLIGDFLEVNVGRHELDVHSFDGRFVVLWCKSLYQPGTRVRLSSFHGNGRGYYDFRSANLRRFHVDWYSFENPPSRSLDAAVPHGCIAAAAALVPAVQGWRWWKRRRHQPGFCCRCGYELIPSPKQVIAIVPDEALPRRQPTPRP